LFKRRSAFHSFGRISRRAGEQPAGQSAARTARCAGRSRLTGDTGLRFIGFGLRFETLRFDNRSGGFDRRFATIFGEGFAGKQECFFAGIRRTRGIRATIAVKVTARAAIFETAAIGIATAAAIIATIASAVTAAIKPPVITTIRTAIVSPFAALRRSVLGRRQIATAARAEVAATAATTTTSTTETASAAPKLRTVTTRTTVATSIVSAIGWTTITTRRVAG